MQFNKTLTHKFGLDTGFTEINSSSIDFPIKKSWLGQRQIVDETVDSFFIEKLCVPSYLVVDELTLLKLKFIGGSGKEGSSIKNFHLTSYNNPYQILLNHDAFMECTDLSKQEAEIRFSVIISFRGESVSQDYKITIKLVKATPMCSVVFVPQKKLKYKHENVCVGHFEIENKCAYRYAEPAAINLKIKYPVQFNENLVSFAALKDIKEENPYYEESGLREKGELPISCLKSTRISDQEIELKRIIAQNKITLPVYLDLDALDNPEQDFRVEKFIAISKNILNELPNDPIECKVPIYRDNACTRLFVTCNGKVVLNNTNDVYGHYFWIERQTGRVERFAGTIQIAAIIIGNEATNRGVSPSSAVIIQNLKIIPVVNASEIVSDTLDFLNTKEIEGEQYILKNGIDSRLSYSCKLLHKGIIDIPNNNSKITFNIEFDYIEDVNGVFDNEELQWTHFSSEASIEIEKDPGSEWLCVDYGTSATVAVFGDGTEKNTQLLRLNERNKEILNEREEERYRTPRFENGDYFLSSNLMFNNDATVYSDSIDKPLVFLSPSVPRYHSNVYRLPYLKALAGYKSIPNGKSFFRFQYKLHESDEATISFKDSPLDVDNIFSATYRALFKDYISKCIPEAKNVNKIVLTVPNTYTPHHIEYLRKIVKKEIPSLRSDYIWFVSESDSIAYYYLNKWDTFNSNQDCDKSFVEHVLVYDMGAGTLDLTYLTISHQTDGDKAVEMVSKMGLNKAGNYLDYILAKALVEEYPDVFPKEILLKAEGAMFMLQGKLKYFITNNLKPKLFDEETLVFSAWNGQFILGKDVQDIELDLVRIRSNSNVQSFIKECTDELFERFTQISNLTMDTNPIDTVLMTGRSIQFGDIKRRLQQAINNWNDDNHCKSIEISGDQLKTIVSQGSLYYAALYGKRTSSVILNNRNIYAKYGVLYVDRKNHWCYQPLIDTSTKSTSKSVSIVGQQNGMQIYTYDTDRYSADESTDYISLDMRNTIESYLVQCYSPDPASDYDDVERRNDYISIMAAFNPESVCQDKRNVHVRLVIDKNNEMTFTAGDLEFEASAPIKIDVETNNTFKHSMWPYA